VNPVPDSFLLTTASIAATLIGLLLLGTFFYVETGFRRAAQIAPLGAPFLRATTRFTLLLYLLVLAISLGEVVLRRPWMLALYGAVGLALLASMVAWVQAYRDLSRVLPIPRSSPWIVSPAIVGMLALPFVLDGWEPGREALTWTLLIAGLLAIMSTTDMLLTSFDLARLEQMANQPVDADEEPDPA
jgi:hypothetical protein